ncbi:MAG: hypothetical protein HY023_16745 [Chloroflexi bacterium]|nr:hypothetical protein [Chloroflexota bacterium]MBI3763741.1 hypothetical protein [Chloroflexota bacterium]
MGSAPKPPKKTGREVEVDQSGRTDVLAVGTVVAFSDGLQSSLRISSKVKRECFRRLKARGVRKHLIGIKLFAAGIALILEPFLPWLTIVIIDLEYVGWEAVIKEQVVRQWRRHRPDSKIPKIEFRQIGKGSRAHDLALAVYRGEQKADREAEAEELLAAC